MRKRKPITKKDGLLVLDISADLGNDDWLRTAMLKKGSKEFNKRFNIPLYDYSKKDLA